MFFYKEDKKIKKSLDFLKPCGIIASTNKRSTNKCSANERLQHGGYGYMNIILALILAVFGVRVIMVCFYKDFLGKCLGVVCIFMALVSSVSTFSFASAATAAAAAIMICCQVSFILLTVYHLGKKKSRRVNILSGQNENVSTVQKNPSVCA